MLDGGQRARGEAYDGGSLTSPSSTGRDPRICSARWIGSGIRSAGRCCRVERRTVTPTVTTKEPTRCPLRQLFADGVTRRGSRAWHRLGESSSVALVGSGASALSASSARRRRLGRRPRPSSASSDPSSDAVPRRRRRPSSSSTSSTPNSSAMSSVLPDASVTVAAARRRPAPCRGGRRRRSGAELIALLHTLEVLVRADSEPLRVVDDAGR